MSNELARVPQAQYTPNDISLMAEQVARSRMFGMDAAQAFTLMLLCQAKGLHPIEAVQRYHIIAGRPAMKTDAMLAEFQSHGGTVEWKTVNDTEVEAVFRHPTNAPEGVTSRFTIADAKRADLMKNAMYSKYPQNMLRARVISNGIRMVMPGIIAGIYTPEECTDMEPPKWVEARVVEEPGPVAKPAPAAPVTPSPAKEALREKASAKLPYWKWAAGAVDFGNRNFRKACEAERIDVAESAAIVNSYQLGRHLLRFAVASGWTADPGSIDNASVTKILDGLWTGEKADEIRAEAKAYFETKTREAVIKMKDRGDAWEGDEGDEAEAETATADPADVIGETLVNMLDTQN